MHLIPAYGRDYKSKKEVQAAFDANQDFLVSDMSSPDNGRYVNKVQLPKGSTVNIRYKKLASVTVITVK